MQQARQYLANVPVNIQSLQPEPLEVQDDLMSNDPEEITASFWYSDVGGWWLKQETSMGEYRDLAKMARDIFSVMPHGVGVESSFCLGRDVIEWRQCRTTGVILQQKVDGGNGQETMEACCPMRLRCQWIRWLTRRRRQKRRTKSLK